MIAISILCLLFGPMILYSSLNPMLADNPPISSSVSVLLK